MYSISGIKYGATTIFSFYTLDLVLIIIHRTLPLGLLRIFAVSFTPNFYFSCKTLIKFNTSISVKLFAHIFTQR